MVRVLRTIPRPAAVLELPTCDRKVRRRPGRHQPNTSRAERSFARALSSVARHVGELISGFTPGDIDMIPSLKGLLTRYADVLTPWATNTVERMLAEVNDSDENAWRSLGNLISKALHREITTTPVGGILKGLLQDQVELIRSLPIEAAERVHQLTLKGLQDSTRAGEIAQEIARSGQVTVSRAVLIARTEVSRTATALTQSRAQHIGITHYHWRTVGDMDVRPAHRVMNGKVCEWAHPPAVHEDGKTMHFHPGQIWNCRCWADPIIDLRRLS